MQNWQSGFIFLSYAFGLFVFIVGKAPEWAEKSNQRRDRAYPDASPDSKLYRTYPYLLRAYGRLRLTSEDPKPRAIRNYRDYRIAYELDKMR